MFKKLKILCLFLALAIPFCVVGCDKKEQKPQEKTPYLSHTEISLKIDESFTLHVLDNQSPVEWGVSDRNIVSVENGVVKAVGIGVANVTAIVGDKLLACKVICEVDYVEVPKLIFKDEVKGENGYVVTLQVGDSYELTPQLLKAGVALDGISIMATSANESVSVNGTTVSAVSLTNGTAVTFSCEYEGQTYQLILTVVVK